MVVVPLITPMAAADVSDPIHLGIIVLAHMRLGYLRPPMGEDLFLSDYRFNQSSARKYDLSSPTMKHRRVVSSPHCTPAPR
jgi:TRAP-type C4-dicarboxylate transport system permease large subunit